jgi:hypothetical protein
VLGDHADTGRDGIAGRADAHGPAVDADGAGVRARQPVEDAHERGLARAVLAEEGVDLAAREPEIDLVVGDEVPEALAMFAIRRQVTRLPYRSPDGCRG